MIRSKLGMLFLITLLFAVVSSCKVELYSNLAEKEANEMLAILLRSGIDSDKLSGKEQTWGLRVNKGEIARAVEILKDAGYPKDRFVSIGDIFKKEGLVSSPLEERARFIYALSQGISETLSQIDGVLTARTQIVLPENNPLSDTLKPSSASVFIKYKPESDIESRVPKIKKLVVNSIEGLNYDKVTVVLFPSQNQTSREKKQKYAKILSVKIAPESVRSFWILTGGLTLLTLAALAGMGYLFLKNRQKE